MLTNRAIKIIRTSYTTKKEALRTKPAPVFFGTAMYLR